MEHNAEIWRRLKKNKGAVVGLFVLVILVLAAIFAEWISPYSRGIEMNIAERLQPPSAQHLFGTDNFGRDVFTRVLHGARISLALGLGTSLISIVVAGLLGAVAAYFGGWVDNAIMRVIDVFTSIPPILLALAVVSALGGNLVNLLIAITIAEVPGYTRILRSVFLGVVEMDYVESARAFGTSDFRIICKHVVPNAMGYVIVQMASGIASMILYAAALSFVGMGIQPPSPEWGAMLSEAREFMRDFPYLMIFPGAAIVTAALSFNLLGDGLRDALDPRLRD